MEEVAQESGGCPASGNIQGHPGLGSEQPDLIEDDHAHCRNARLDDPYRALLALPVLLFSVQQQCPQKYQSLQYREKAETPSGKIGRKRSAHFLKT